MSDTRTEGGTTITHTYDDNDKVTKIGTTAGGSDLATFGYDGARNMASVSGCPCQPPAKPP